MPWGTGRPQVGHSVRGGGAIETGPTLSENPPPGGEDICSPARPAARLPHKGSRRTVPLAPATQTLPWVTHTARRFSLTPLTWGIQVLPFQ